MDKWLSKIQKTLKKGSGSKQKESEADKLSS